MSIRSLTLTSGELIYYNADNKSGYYRIYDDFKLNEPFGLTAYAKVLMRCKG